MNKFLKPLKNLTRKIPLVGFAGDARMFLIIDVKGRIILEDCDRIKTFTDKLLIVGQGDLIVTVTGVGLKLRNMSHHSGELTGKVDNIKVEYTSARDYSA